MKISRLFQTKSALSIILLLTVLSTYFVGITFYTPAQSKVLAYTTTCPSSMDDYECLEYLQKQSERINKDKGKLNQGISSENYQQLTLNEKISYLNNQIAKTEATIGELEVEIETKNVQIRILGKDIEQTQNNINTISQEVSRLESSVDKRIALSYRYSFVTPVELFLETTNFESFLRRMKYLLETRKKDKELLNEMVSKSDVLKAEEEALAKKQEEVQKKRNEIEEEKTELFEEKENLADQKSEQANLLAISRQKESEYQASLASLKKQGDVITAQISQLIFNLYQSGQLPANTPVDKGEIIGFQGHTGLAFGSHLHFELRKNGSIINPYSTGHFTWPNASKSSRFPLDGATITQFPHYNSNAIDMVSTTSGNQNGDKYYTKGVNCSYGSVPAGYYNLRGEGAPLRAIRNGKVSNVFTDVCGGKAVIVDYGNGLAALYLHLR